MLFLPQIGRQHCSSRHWRHLLQQIIINTNGLARGGDGCSCSNSRVQPARNLWKFKHVYMPERTPDGEQQRKPTEHPDFMKYTPKFIRMFKLQPPPIKVILLQSIEDVGQKYDVVEMDAKKAHRLLLKQEVVYASPFDLEYYEQKKKEMYAKGEQEIIRVPKELTKFARQLISKVVPLLVSQEAEWTLNKDIVAASLEQMGLNVPTRDIHMADEEPMKGPDLMEEARLIRFYVVLQEVMILPMLGRITHISPEEDQNLFPAEEKQREVGTQRLAKFGLRPEQPFYSADGLAGVVGQQNVGAFMAKRPKDAVAGVN